MERKKLRWLARCPDDPPPLPHITCHRPAWNGRTPVAVVDFSDCFEEGTVTAFKGSRDGKTGLLMNILGLIERPDSGHIRVFGEAVLEMESEALADCAIGLSLSLHSPTSPSLPSPWRDIAMPYLRHHGNAIDSARDRIAEVLAVSGLPLSSANLAVANLDEESLWRVAFARSIVHLSQNPRRRFAASSFSSSFAKAHAQATGIGGSLEHDDTRAVAPCDRILPVGNSEKTK